MTTTVTSLEQLHAIEVEILTEIGRVCDKHGIRWFLHAGTLLGALRHGGPIPWDDDADIGMMHDDFERFRKVAPKELGSRFAFIEPRDYEQFFDFIPRVTDLEHVYASSFEDAQAFDGRLDHPDVDIFVFELAKTGVADKVQSARLTANYAKALGHRPNLDHGAFKGASKIASYLLPALGHRKGLKALVDERNRMGNTASDDSKWLRIVNEQPLNWDKRYRASWFVGKRTASFAGEEFPIPKWAERVVEELYGAKWRDLPPESERRPKHSYLS